MTDEMTCTTMMYLVPYMAKRKKVKKGSEMTEAATHDDIRHLTGRKDLKYGRTLFLVSVTR